MFDVVDVVDVVDVGEVWPLCLSFIHLYELSFSKRYCTVCSERLKYSVCFPPAPQFARAGKCLLLTRLNLDERLRTMRNGG